MATYTKLQSGNWGVRVTGDAPRPGQRVTVTKKDGGTKTEIIARVLWSGNGVYLCAIAQRQHSGCGCDSDCCRPRCRCDSHCNCRGGNIYDC